MTTLEKIEIAENRIKELQLLINHWKITSNSVDQNLVLYPKHKSHTTNLKAA
ncbi:MULTISPECIES: hypothetical protein [unclassified Prochlorococcus]|uniref:hypothetical protein n=1 Tax=unclassified Prochlorococcus TaxID=2627481 RepID=UPI000533AE2D|nr:MULTISPECIES: hypothetical protein [unclassified Prochlorococcus]KGG15322.1 hypothetical protein EV06_1193 [Prochlorococcus sp. MIT 0602]KGG17600.1 hypothetical protein EV07_1040 [Prochlorococcus sp. MIT 0603]